MVYDGVLEGKYVDLKSVQESDAEFTLKLRQNPEIIKYLPRLDNTVEQQREWIRKQQLKTDDYFFIITEKKGKPIGTISIYDIEPMKSAETGRLAIQGNAFQSIEAQYLLYIFAFDILQLRNTYGFAYSTNSRIQRFNKIFGVYKEDEKINMYDTEVEKYICQSENFSEKVETIKKMLYR